MGDDSKAYERAKRRVNMLKSFYIHLLFYIGVISMLVVIDILDGENWWFFWPMFGWGIAVAIHGAVVFLAGGSIAGDWEERKIRELMEKDRRSGDG